MSDRGYFRFLKGLDMFGKQTPQLNVRGESEVRTNFGGVVSLFILFITFLFASHKMLQLV